jgi:type IV pilus assembly protein PilM
VALEPGVVRDGEVVDAEALTEALRTLFRDNQSFDKRVRIGIANQKIVVRVVELPLITDPKELETAVRFTAADQIPMPLDTAVLDYQQLGIVETDDGPRMRVALVAARRDMVTQFLDVVRDAGLRAEGLDLSAFAMVRALHVPGGVGETVLYLAIGGVTNLAVANGLDCLFTRVVDAGLEGLAIELAERAELPLTEARKWLHVVGLKAGSIEEIDGHEEHREVIEQARAILLDGVRRIVGNVRNSLDFHHAQNGAAGVARCVLTGEAASIPGFPELLARELGLDVDARAVDHLDQDLDAARYAVAAGLAISEAVA